MSYAERRSGKLTGWWYGEAHVNKPSGLELRFRRRFKLKGEADGYEAYVKATGEEPPHLLQAPQESFAAVAERFKAANPKWGRRDRSALQRLAYVVSQIGDMDVRAVRTVTLDKLVEGLAKRPGKREGRRLSERTINRYLDAAAVVLDYAHERDLIEGKPHVPRRGEDPEGNRKHILTFDMEDAICGWLEQHKPIIGSRCSFLVRVLCATGLRRSELYKLRPEQIENAVIALRGDQTKTNRPRRVPIDSEMATKLRAMVAAGGLVSAPHLWRAFKDAAKACGYAEELTLHSLRHTTVTRLVRSGVDTLLVADIAGHSNLNTTRLYTHTDDDVLAEAVKKVHQARGKTVESVPEVVTVDFKKRA